MPHHGKSWESCSLPIACSSTSFCVWWIHRKLRINCNELTTDGLWENFITGCLKPNKRLNSPVCNPFPKTSFANSRYWWDRQSGKRIFPAYLFIPTWPSWHPHTAAYHNDAELPKVASRKRARDLCLYVALPFRRVSIPAPLSVTIPRKNCQAFRSDN